MTIESKFDIGDKVKVIKPTKAETTLEIYNVTKYGGGTYTIKAIIYRDNHDGDCEIVYRLDRAIGTIPERFIEKAEE